VPENQLDLISYYQAIEGKYDSNFGLDEGVWYVNFDKKHSFIISSDYGGLDSNNE